MFPLMVRMICILPSQLYSGPSPACAPTDTGTLMWKMAHAVRLAGLRRKRSGSEEKTCVLPVRWRCSHRRVDADAPGLFCDTPVCDVCTGLKEK